jgi:hypothetical protein
MRTHVEVVPFAIAGMIATVWFTTLVIVQGLVQPDYSHIALPISALTAWPAGWLQRLNFYVTATLMAAFTLSLHRTVRPTRFGLVGIVLLLASCAGIFLAGVFPCFFAIEEGTPFHAWAGFLQRLLVAIWFAGILVMARRVLRLARGTDGA